MEVKIRGSMQCEKIRKREPFRLGSKEKYIINLDPDAVQTAASLM